MKRNSKSKKKSKRQPVNGGDIVHISQLKPDPANVRKHNPRNVGMITSALQEIGAARSGVIDETGRVLAGNATLEALAQAGIERVKVVDAKGDEWVVVRRRGLTEKQKVRLALYDNRTSELSTWDVDALEGLNEKHLLDGLFKETEIKNLFQSPDQEIMLDQAVQLRPAREYIVVMCEDDGGVEWDKLREVLDLKIVRRGGYKQTSVFDDHGIERVVPAKILLAKLHADSDTE